MTILTLRSAKWYILIPIYLAIDGVIISGITFLLILTIRTSSAVWNELTNVDSANTNKNITKISLQIMLLSCYFHAPHLIMNFLREVIQETRFFSTQPQCCLTFSWIEFQMLLRCCLIHINVIILRHLLFVSMSRTWFIYVLSVWYVFHFPLHFHYD